MSLGTHTFSVDSVDNLNNAGTNTVKVTPPKGYKSSTPASQAFTWNAVGVTLSNFVLN